MLNVYNMISPPNEGGFKGGRNNPRPTSENNRCGKGANGTNNAINLRTSHWFHPSRENHSTSHATPVGKQKAQTLQSHCSRGIELASIE